MTQLFEVSWNVGWGWAEKGAAHLLSPVLQARPGLGVGRTRRESHRPRPLSVLKEPRAPGSSCLGSGFTSFLLMG